MMMLAPLWSVVLVNLGFVGLAWEAATTPRVHWAWAILPVLWFGRYATWAVSDRIVLAQVLQEVAAANARVHVPFDPRGEALVADNGQANMLVQNYDIPVVYTSHASGTGRSYRASRIADKATCDRVRRDPSMQRARISAFGFHDGSKFVRDFCVLSQPEDPARPETRIETIEHAITIRGLPVTETTTTIVRGDDRTVLRGGVASPLPWFPLPMIGCALNSGAPAWKCFAVFQRSRVPLTRREGDALADALGLRRVAPANRKVGDPALVMARAKGAAESTVAFETAALDTVLTDPTATIDSVPFASLRGRMEIILPRLDKIVTAVEQGIAAGSINNYAGRSNAQQMFHLLEQAPPEELTPYRQRIADLQTRDRWFVFEPDPVLQ